MLAVIITGHGKFATGIKSMLNLVLGAVDQIYFIDFTEDLSSDDLNRKYQEIYKKENGNVLFLCDISGGTPFNQASILMYENNKNYGVIGGINIPLILNILDQREESNDMEFMVTSAKIAASENIKIFGEKIEEQRSHSSDGI